MHDLTGYSDEALVELLVQRDDNAFQVVHQRYYERVYRAVYHVLKNQADTEEIVQDAFLALWQNPQQWQSDSDDANLCHWLMTVARFDAIDRLRAQHTRKSVNAEQPSTEEIESIPAQDSVKTSDTWHDIKTLLSDLNTRQFEVISLAYIEGEQTDTIAQSLNLTPREVRHRLRLAKQHLRNLWQQVTQVD